MSLHGVRQLKQLLIRYSDYDGSSKGILEWMRINLVSFAQANPNCMVQTERKRNVHPFLRGVYVNGNSKTICVKNLSAEEIHDYVLHLRNQIGRKMNSTGYKKPVLSKRTSIQGEWSEKMSLINLKLDIKQE
eukprot:gene8160-11044_t